MSYSAMSIAESAYIAGPLRPTPVRLRCSSSMSVAILLGSRPTHIGPIKVSSAALVAGKMRCPKPSPQPDAPVGVHAHEQRIHAGAWPPALLREHRALDDHWHVNDDRLDFGDSHFGYSVSGCRGMSVEGTTRDEDSESRVKPLIIRHPSLVTRQSMIGNCFSCAGSERR